MRRLGLWRSTCRDFFGSVFLKLCRRESLCSGANHHRSAMPSIEARSCKDRETFRAGARRHAQNSRPCKVCHLHTPPAVLSTAFMLCRGLQRQCQSPPAEPLLIPLPILTVPLHHCRVQSSLVIPLGSAPPTMRVACRCPQWSPGALSALDGWLPAPAVMSQFGHNSKSAGAIGATRPSRKRTDFSTESGLGT